MSERTCFYCGGKEFELQYHGAHPHMYSVLCTQCGISGPIGEGDTEEVGEMFAWKFLDEMLAKAYGTLSETDANKIKKRYKD